MRARDLRDSNGRRLPIPTLKPNYNKSRLEMEIDEPTFLAHAEAIALSCRTPGNGIKVVAVRDDTPRAELPEVFANTPFKKIVKIAAEEGIDLTACKTNAERVAAINAARAELHKAFSV